MGGMSKYLHKSHNVSVLIYHTVFQAKYRQVIFDNGGRPRAKAHLLGDFRTVQDRVARDRDGQKTMGIL